MGQATTLNYREKQDQISFLNQGLEPGESWFFWCVKTQKISEYTGSPDGWNWPPAISGRVAAKNKKHARERISEELDMNIPLRVSAKDRPTSPYLLYIEEITEDKPASLRYLQRFMPRQCEVCHTTFVLNDIYNTEIKNIHADTCSTTCNDAFRLRMKSQSFEEGTGVRPDTTTIYLITYTPENKHYVGKTTQPFTLRWYQHMYHPGDSAFHKKIRTSPLADWQFKVLEEINPLHELSSGDLSKHIAQREQFWIDHYNSIQNGFNSVSASTLET